MKPYEDMLRRIREFLMEDRAPSISVKEALRLPDGFTLVTADLLQQREESESARRLGAMLDEILALSSVTNGCKERLKEMILTIYHFGLSPEFILSLLVHRDEGGVGPFEQLDFAAYERRMLIASAESITSVGVAIDALPQLKQWAREWQACYDGAGDEVVNRLLEWAVGIVPD